MTLKILSIQFEPYYGIAYNIFHVPVPMLHVNLVNCFLLTGLLNKQDEVIFTDTISALQESIKGIS